MAADVSIPFNDYAMTTVELTLTDADVANIANQFPDKPLAWDTGVSMLGTITIVANQRATALELMKALKNNPAKPQVRLRYMCQGGCADLQGVQISKITETVDRNRANINAFGMGISLAVIPQISQGLSRVASDGCPAGQKRKIQDFLIDWNLDWSITPGAGGTATIRTETQRVLSPCCPLG